MGSAASRLGVIERIASTGRLAKLVVTVGMPAEANSNGGTLGWGAYIRQSPTSCPETKRWYSSSGIRLAISSLRPCLSAR